MAEQPIRDEIRNVGSGTHLGLVDIGGSKDPTARFALQFPTESAAPPPEPTDDPLVIGALCEETLRARGLRVSAETPVCPSVCPTAGRTPDESPDELDSPFP